MWGFTRPVRPGYWFAQRRYGFGFTPANAMGWAATSAFLAIFGLTMWLVRDDWLRIVAGSVIAFAYLTLALFKTDGGWRWRWGDQD